MHTLDTLETLKAEIEKLPPRRQLSPYEVVAELAESISGARTRGYDIDHIVTMLRAAGINLARTTVRNYLSRALRAAESAPESPMQPAIANAAAPPRHSHPTMESRRNSTRPRLHRS